MILINNNEAKCQDIYPDTDTSQNRIDSTWITKLGFGIISGLNFCNIYWKQKDNDIFIINNRPIAVILRAKTFFIQPGVDFSVYQKIRLTNFLALSVDLGLSYQNQTASYDWSYIDSTGNNRSNKIYSTTREIGETDYHLFFIPLTIAADVYPFHDKIVFLHAGLRPELVLYGNSNSYFTDRQENYTKDTLGYQHTIYDNSQPGERKVKVSSNLGEVLGLGLILKRKSHHPFHLEMDYFQSASPFNTSLFPFRLSEFEIKLAIKI